MGTVASSYFAGTGTGVIDSEEKNSQQLPGLEKLTTAAAGEKHQQQQQENIKNGTRQRPRRPAQRNVLPLLGNGRFEVGCADIMVTLSANKKDEPEQQLEELEKCNGLFARIFYPNKYIGGEEKEEKSDEEREKEKEKKEKGEKEEGVLNLEEEEENLFILSPSASSPSKTSKSTPNNGCSNNSDDEFMPWRPDDFVVAGLAAYREMSHWKMKTMLSWVLGDKRIPARWQLPLLEGPSMFPVAVFSHGISGTRHFYSTFCSSLASHGYVVAALEHRDGSSCYTFELEKDSETGELKRKPIEMRKLPHDEEEYESRIAQIRIRATESFRMLELFGEMNTGLATSKHFEVVSGNEFDWEQFKNRLNVDYAVSIGHSFGGASAITACAIQPAFKCCVVMDAWLYPFECKHYEALKQPVLMLNASKWQWPVNLKRLLHLQKQAGGVGKSMFTFTDIVHQSFSDFGMLVPGRIGRFLGLQGVEDPEHLANIIMQLVVAFLSSPHESVERLHQLYESLNCPFVVEGTNVPSEELEKIPLNLAEEHSQSIGECEEKLIHEGGE